MSWELSDLNVLRTLGPKCLEIFLVLNKTCEHCSSCGIRVKLLILLKKKRFLHWKLLFRIFAKKKLCFFAVPVSAWSCPSYWKIFIRRKNFLIENTFLSKENFLLELLPRKSFTSLHPREGEASHLTGNFLQEKKTFY